MSPAVVITTGARLHFGLMVRGEPDRRCYGGIGVMIDQPRFAVTVRAARSDQIAASPEVTQRVCEFLSRLREAGYPGSWDVVVRDEIPLHAGFGSGTQLGLALARAVSRLSGEGDVAIEELARRVGRGARSAIGTIGFAAGGLIAYGDEIGEEHRRREPLRRDFPANWRFVLVTPPDHAGLSGDHERQTFRTMPAMTNGLWSTLHEKSRRLTAGPDATQQPEYPRNHAFPPPFREQPLHAEPCEISRLSCRP